ncbi:hypothetical protein J1605_002558 [Eschrichtius robustus]|uniref:Uncharacterized protein n=1 Tax=Eschrichtius robustus TaxID=9764 RepID=A0AB34HVU9_ESCRO|nr:hypothetical protein J1605_002558 [Eschrichtius robustus]
MTGSRRALGPAFTTQPPQLPRPTQTSSEVGSDRRYRALAEPGPGRGAAGRGRPGGLRVGAGLRGRLAEGEAATTAEATTPMEARRGPAERAPYWGLLVLALGFFLLHCDPFTCFSFLSSPPPGPSFEDSTLSTTTTLESIPSSTGEPKCQRPRTLMRQQSLQQPLSQHQRGRQTSQPTTSQSLGQLQAHVASVPGPNSRAYGRGQARQGSSAGSKYRPAGGRSRSNPGSWDHVVGQIRNRGLDMKSFL